MIQERAMNMLTPQERGMTVEEHLAKQNPVHGMMGRVADRMGGEEAMLEWAEENPTEFYKLLIKVAPAAPPKGQTGGIHLHVHNGLQPGPLDLAQGVTIEQTADDAG
jgi:hypothetical protein